VGTKSITSALLDFRRARRRADLEALLALFRDEPAELLCYDEVRERLEGARSPGRELREIELDRIVGSVGRCTDFTRSFLPRQDSDADRWARTDVKMTDLVGLPPIEVFELGGVYFVQEGHHRVSVARVTGATHIQAYVTKVRTQVSLPPDADVQEVIVQAEYADFLSRTRLDTLRPKAELSVSVPGQYRKLLEHIDVHRYFMGLEEGRPITYEEAVEHWYDWFYLPIVEAIRRRGILQEFPARTETDLYIWVAEHRHELVEELGWDVDAGAAAEDLAQRFGEADGGLIQRVSNVVLTALRPRELDPGPPPGLWREERTTAARGDRLFHDVLVVIDGAESGWRALEQVALLARHEETRAHGIHVVPSDASLDEARDVVEAFSDHLQRWDLEGELTVRAGDFEAEVAALARWTDLVVAASRPPESQGDDRPLGGGVRGILGPSPQPVLVVPGTPTGLERAVLAYDGSAKADEALFVATYAAAEWGVEVTVVTAHERTRQGQQILKRACRYLSERGVEVRAIASRGGAAEAIKEIVEASDADLVIMGGYGFGPVMKRVLGSTVDRVLRESSVPVLVCR